MKGQNSPALTCSRQPDNLGPSCSPLAQRHGVLRSAKRRRIIVDITDGYHSSDTRALLGNAAVRHHHSEVVQRLGFKVESFGQKQGPDRLKAPPFQEPHTALNLERVPFVAVGNSKVEAAVLPRQIAVKGLESQHRRARDGVFRHCGPVDRVTPRLKKNKAATIPNYRDTQRTNSEG